MQPCQSKPRGVSVVTRVLHSRIGNSMAEFGRGSPGNVLAALASFIIPGLGQLAQGRLLAALLWFLFAGFLWLITLGLLGWLAHVLSAADAALWRGPRRARLDVD